MSTEGRVHCRGCLYSAQSFSAVTFPTNPADTKYVNLCICRVVNRECLYEGKVRPSWCPLDWGYPLPKKLRQLGHVSKYAMAKAGIHKFRGKRKKKKGFQAKRR